MPDQHDANIAETALRRGSNKAPVITHMPFNIGFRYVLVIINRIVGMLCFLVLPLVFVRHLLVCSWCDNVFILDNIPVFNVLLSHNNLTIGDLCVLEMACRLSLLFRIFYISIDHESIMNDRVSRIRSLGRKPRENLIMCVAVIFVMTLIWVDNAYFLSWNYISAHGPSTVAFSLTLAISLLFYMLPELIVYILYIIMDKV